MGIGMGKSMSMGIGMGISMCIGIGIGMGIGMGICKYNDGDRISTYALKSKVVILVYLRKVSEKKSREKSVKSQCKK